MGQGKVGIDLHSLFERGSLAFNVVEVVQDQRQLIGNPALSGRTAIASR
jgi:hypothetical protein